MTDDLIKKRTEETITEIFPLDRLLPLETVHKIFVEEYSKVQKKIIFRDERKFQRLREGYFVLFAAVSFTDINKKKCYLVFPSDPSNDVYICQIKDVTKPRPQFEAHPFDVKEYTEYSNSFEDFVSRSISKRLGTYNLIIASYKQMNWNDLKILFGLIKELAPNSKVWITGNSEINQDNIESAKVTVVSKEGIIYEKNINLDHWLDKGVDPIVYQDVIRFK